MSCICNKGFLRFFFFFCLIIWCCIRGAAVSARTPWPDCPWSPPPVHLVGPQCFPRPAERHLSGRHPRCLSHLNRFFSMSSSYQVTELFILPVRVTKLVTLSVRVRPAMLYLSLLWTTPRDTWPSPPEAHESLSNNLKKASHLFLTSCGQWAANWNGTAWNEAGMTHSGSLCTFKLDSDRNAQWTANQMNTTIY